MEGKQPQVQSASSSGLKTQPDLCMFPKELLMSQTTPTTATPPTVVLVHGAFADASSWTGVIERLQARGVAATAPPNPLRGISGDSAYLASATRQTPRPLLAAGHTYGEAAISNAATQ